MCAGEADCSSVCSAVANAPFHLLSLRGGAAEVGRGRAVSELGVSIASARAILEASANVPTSAGIVTSDWPLPSSPFSLPTAACFVRVSECR